VACLSPRSLASARIWCRAIGDLAQRFQTRCSNAEPRPRAASSTSCACGRSTPRAAAVAREHLGAGPSVPASSNRPGASGGPATRGREEMPVTRVGAVGRVHRMGGRDLGEDQCTDNITCFRMQILIEAAVESRDAALCGRGGWRRTASSSAPTSPWRHDSRPEVRKCNPYSGFVLVRPRAGRFHLHVMPSSHDARANSASQECGRARIVTGDLASIACATSSPAARRSP